MPKSIDFKALSLVDALDLAIFIEDEAKERYEEFAEQMKQHGTPEAERFFRSMAVNEAKHGSELRERRLRLFPAAPRAVTREMLWDVEAPEYETVRMFMSAREAMEVALEAEIKAHDYFDSALPFVTNGDVKALFEELREEEVEHQELVKAVLAKLPADPGTDPELYADEPVGH
jgi:erythrin-vacuolar iron transport family protein